MALGHCLWILLAYMFVDMHGFPEVTNAHRYQSKKNRMAMKGLLWRVDNSSLTINGRRGNFHVAFNRGFYGRGWDGAVQWGNSTQCPSCAGARGRPRTMQA